MNTFRTFFLIIVSAIQISGMFTKSTLESLQLTEFAAKACKDVKHDDSFTITKITNDLQQNQKADFQRLNCQETSTKSKVQNGIVSDKNENLPVVKPTDNNQQTIKRSGVISQIRFDGTVTAELF